MKKLFILFVVISSIALIGCESKDPKDLIIEAITNSFADKSDILNVEIDQYIEMTEARLLLMQYMTLEEELDKNKASLKYLEKKIKLKSQVSQAWGYELEIIELDKIVAEGKAIFESIDEVKLQIAQNPDTLKPIYYFVIPKITKRSEGVVEIPYFLTMDYEIFDIGF